MRPFRCAMSCRARRENPADQLYGSWETPLCGCGGDFPGVWSEMVLLIASAAVTAPARTKSARLRSCQGWCHRRGAVAPFPAPQMLGAESRGTGVVQPASVATRRRSALRGRRHALRSTLLDEAWPRCVALTRFPTARGGSGVATAPECGRIDTPSRRCCGRLVNSPAPIVGTRASRARGEPRYFGAVLRRRNTAGATLLARLATSWQSRQALAALARRAAVALE